MLYIEIKRHIFILHFHCIEIKKHKKYIYFMIYRPRSKVC